MVSSVFYFPCGTVHLYVRGCSNSVLYVYYLLYGYSVDYSCVSGFRVQGLYYGPVYIARVVGDTSSILARIYLCGRSLVGSPGVLVCVSLLRLVPYRFFRLVPMIHVGLTYLVFVDGGVYVRGYAFLVVREVSVRGVRVCQAEGLLVGFFESHDHRVVFMGLHGLRLYICHFLVPVRVSIFYSTTFCGRYASEDRCRHFVVRLVALRGCVVRVFVGVLRLAYRIYYVWYGFLHRRFVFRTGGRGLCFGLSRFFGE